MRGVLREDAVGIRVTATIEAGIVVSPVVLAVTLSGGLDLGLSLGTCGIRAASWLADRTTLSWDDVFDRDVAGL